MFYALNCLFFVHFCSRCVNLSLLTNGRRGSCSSFALSRQMYFWKSGVDSHLVKGWFTGGLGPRGSRSSSPSLRSLHPLHPHNTYAAMSVPSLSTSGPEASSSSGSLKIRTHSLDSPTRTPSMSFSSPSTESIADGLSTYLRSPWRDTRDTLAQRFRQRTKHLGALCLTTESPTGYWLCLVVDVQGPAGKGPYPHPSQPRANTFLRSFSLFFRSF